MTQDGIIEMARQADALSAARVDWDFEWVETFAKLVAEKEREACAKECDNADYLGIAAHHCANAIKARGQA